VEIERDGRHYCFVDTAGIRRKGRVSAKLEKFSVVRALKSLDRCDVALLLIDSSEGITDQDAHVAGYAVERGRGLIIVFNKWDLIKDKKGELQRIKTVWTYKIPTHPLPLPDGFSPDRLGGAADLQGIDACSPNACGNTRPGQPGPGPGGGGPHASMSAGTG
jgi:hypothetical protein